MNGFEAALVIIYNHKFEKNIPIVEAIYRERFRHIYHLVPFYSGVRPNVIAVYEHSHFFHGYIAQGRKSFVKPEITHYIFLGDDLILNPAITGDNYQTLFKLDLDSCFIPWFHEVPGTGGYWPHNRSGILFNPFATQGVEVGRELPTVEEATALLGRHAEPTGRFRFEQVYGKLHFSIRRSRLQQNLRTMLQYLSDRFLRRASLSGTRYPMASSYSDIAVVSAACIDRFCHYCGVFAATKLFVELAIPTALALASDKIVTEKDLDFQGKALWTREELDELKQYGGRLGELLRRFPENYLYLHPIKLSQWNVEGL